MSDQSAVSMQPRSSTPASDRLHNLTIPEAALQLGVSETRLRKTLAETEFETLVEFRQTRTGVRKTTILPPDTIRDLDGYFRSPAMRGGCPFPASPPAWQYNPQADEEAPSTQHKNTAWEPNSQVRESAEEAAYLEQKRAEKNRQREETQTAGAEFAPAQEAIPSASEVASPAVPLAQFNALLFQHNVLREDLGRMQRYLDDCEHLLAEMIHTIVGLETRMQHLEQSRPPDKAVSSLSGALRAVSQGVQNAFLAKGRATASRSSASPSEVYYANVLSRS